ncbi:MAG TPA: metal-sulfur cluster assembly factor [Steroidobacter sp.]|jgi:metal-sulfur cluster biosynthetic enzyme|nr:metal-sulfur cluster assembly factor [Steroidobacter sp.]
MTPNEEDIREGLRSVLDPEVGLNVVDLGLVYGIETAADRVHVRMTMTTPSCPMGSMIVDEARRAIEAVAPLVRDIEVELVWDPPWNPRMMSEHAKQHFGW